MHLLAYFKPCWLVVGIRSNKSVQLEKNSKMVCSLAGPLFSEFLAHNTLFIKHGSKIEHPISNSLDEKITKEITSHNEF